MEQQGKIDGKKIKKLCLRHFNTQQHKQKNCSTQKTIFIEKVFNKSETTKHRIKTRPRTIKTKKNSKKKHQKIAKKTPKIQLLLIKGAILV
jgi:hypothetical protein